MVNVTPLPAVADAVRLCFVVPVVGIVIPHGWVNVMVLVSKPTDKVNVAVPFIPETVPSAVTV
jgi:hypothetical protein